MFYVYILKSQLDASFYIGQTADLEKRLTQHNEGESRTTSKKRPWTIVYSEAFESRSDAIRREHFLKKQRNRQFYQKLYRFAETLIVVFSGVAPIICFPQSRRF